MWGGSIWESLSRSFNVAEKLKLHYKKNARQHNDSDNNSIKEKEKKTLSQDEKTASWLNY